MAQHHLLSVRRDNILSLRRGNILPVRRDNIPNKRAMAAAVMMVTLSGWPGAHAPAYGKTFESFSMAAER